MSCKKCNGCIWFDQCGCEDVCEFYDPVSLEESELVDILEYEEILREQFEHCARLTAEEEGVE